MTANRCILLTLWVLYDIILSGNKGSSPNCHIISLVCSQRAALCLVSGGGLPQLPTFPEAETAEDKT